MRYVGQILLMLAAVTAAGCDSKVVRITGTAMAPTLNDGDRTIVSRSIGVLARGDVVAFYYPRDHSKSFVMRVVGLPAERVQIINGVVSVDGNALVEQYVAEKNKAPDNLGPVVVPRDQYFVMGDNRRNASDSRYWGAVPRELVWGKLGR